MNNKISLLKFEFISTIFILIFGFLSHYLYDIFNQSIFIGIFSPINESVWEHQKLVFWPMTFFMVAEFIFYGRHKEGFVPIKVNSILLAMFINISLFYLYSGILGRHIFVVDILLYIIAIVAAYRFAYKNLRWTSEFYMVDFIAACEFGVLIGLCVLIMIFTFDPPQIGIFMVE
jgi:hypothetical protein